jgi:hypothetical protein
MVVYSIWAANGVARRLKRNNDHWPHSGMCYIVAIAGATTISFHDAAKTAIRCEFELAKARFGNDWQFCLYRGAIHWMIGGS